jgi:hypothetical protein
MRPRPASLGRHLRLRQSCEGTFGPLLRAGNRSSDTPETLGVAKYSGLEAALRTLCDHLDAFEGTEHVPPVAALPKKAAEWTPDLGEEIVAQVE